MTNVQKGDGRNHKRDSCQGRIYRALIIGYGIMGEDIALSFIHRGLRVTVLSCYPGCVGVIPNGIKLVAESPDDPSDLTIKADDYGYRNFAVSYQPSFCSQYGGLP